MNRFDPEELAPAITRRGARNFIAKFLGWTLTGISTIAILATNMPASANEKKSRATLQVSATVLTMLKIRVTNQQSQLNIERQHVDQGYIDALDASALLITSNSPDGFMMSVTHDPLLVSHVSATLSLGGSTAKGESMISVRTQHAREEPLRISYRLYLNPKTPVGRLPWPVALSFTPRAV